MMFRFVVKLLVCLLACLSAAQAHEVRPAYLQIDEQSPKQYELLWKIPTKDGMVQNIRPAFDSGFTLTPLPGQNVINGFVLFRYRLIGEKDLAGSTLVIENLNRTAMDTLVNISLLDGSHYSLLLKPRENAIEIPQAETGLQLVFSYTRLGIEHILEGWDHLAFVAALMLIVSGWPMLFKTITAFTVAHSITLGLATLDYVSLPPPPVEAMIALSIVLITAEAIQLRNGRQTLASRWPWTLAFTFGLLHGFGFAGALKEIGLPQVDVPVALLFFNVGVELGQLLFIATLLALIGLYRKLATFPKAAPVYSAYCIGTLATFWLIERLDSMFIS
ncbi:HupE/UreJ family protein [Vibrio sp. Y2-5]|uniref:HupE/UreJ family protein n=1 Tax=Vibrio sp. Y2-5 TaxID=2743977 RepID=UPI001CB73EBB|nr:HupE/UreJ family protein [Vibrio sp. Y2-5]